MEIYIYPYIGWSFNLRFSNIYVVYYNIKNNFMDMRFYFRYCFIVYNTVIYASNLVIKYKFLCNSTVLTSIYLSPSL